MSLTEIGDIQTAVQSVFRKLKKLHAKVTPVYDEFGFKAPSAGVLARDLSEKIELSIAQHCQAFEKQPGHPDLWRGGREWEVKICKGTGLTINQSKVLRGENYIVVNYSPDSSVRRIWVLWHAEDGDFSPRKANSNARTINVEAARARIQVLFDADGKLEGDD